MAKHGLPGTLCKQPFHFYTFINTYEGTSVLTDDSLVWNCYYSQGFAKLWKNGNYEQFNNICSLSKIKDFSVVTDKPQSFTSVSYGYCQDFYKESASICEKTPTKAEADKMKTVIESNGPGAYSFKIETPSSDKYNFYQYLSSIMVVQEKYNVSNALEMLTKTVCFNSKNKLTSGMKEIKIDGKIGSYINIHEVKTSDFSPSCLFTNPAIQKVKMFVNVELETNHVFTYINNRCKNKKMISMQEVIVPDDFVFWDNISSYIQLIGLIKFLNGNDISGQLEQEIIEAMDLYYKNRDAITAWRRMYKMFETIVLGYYDRITTKLTIDGIAQLKTKVTEFIMNFNYLRNDESFINVRKLINLIPKTQLMRNFIGTNGAFEIVSSILKLITILETGKKSSDSKIPLDEMFRTIGYVCIRVLYGESNAMIPKIRSRAAFLGGPSGTLNNETLNENIKYLVDAFKNKMLDKGVEKLKKRVLSYQEMDDTIKAVIKKSFDKINNVAITENTEDLIKSIKADEVLYNSLREDIDEMLMNGEELRDIVSLADYLDNTLFNSFIKSFLAIGSALGQHTNGVDTTNVLNAIRVAPGSKRDEEKTAPGNMLERKIVDLDKAPVANVIEVNTKKLLKGATLKEGHREDQLKTDLDNYSRGMIKAL